MRASAVTSKPNTSATCLFCGEWPACLYRDLNEKHGPRVCEECVKSGRTIQNEKGVWIVNPDFVAPTPESPAETAELPA